MTDRHLQTPIMHRVVESNGLVFLGGVTADDESLDMAGQTLQVLTKIDQYLAVAGTDNSKLLSATIFLTDLGQKPQMDTVWKTWLAKDDLPARATVGVADLGGNALIEVVITATK
ncbi:RidA family protein [Pseudomonas typographi]|uniref:RidA family protein n=1 Tax=Pseudomonas typographi TaxID=2715964 RepID=A0ABR7Z1V6_9PSED|nr:RidA family protein [Pseudomonas typographi]MBD1551561.1 RidA family protein [Pseudomonas typographi]MBD1587453.1 RidA family protein [Pseudomonas typographi]MBD1599465.1 RidA family protein [Pseudomonas typographi]